MRMKESKRMKEDDKKVKGCKRMRRINLDDKCIVIIVWGEKGQPQQFLVRATFFSFSHPGHLYILVARIKKNIIGSTRILRWLGRENEENVARMRNCCGWPSSPQTHILLMLIFIRISFPKRNWNLFYFVL